MSFNYDVDELDDEMDLDVADDVSAEDSGEEYDDLEGNFEDIDFEALGINPQGPTAAKPGSEAKVLMLAARYAAGVPLWHDSDCYDHGPGEAMARMLRMGGQAAPKN